jgi:hypothetical protein
MTRSQRYRPNRKLVFLTGGGENARKLQPSISPEADHVFDWFHIAMRVTVLGRWQRVPAALMTGARSLRATPIA